MCSLNANEMLKINKRIQIRTEELKEFEEMLIYLVGAKKGAAMVLDYGKQGIV